jgi:hypothetical protein
MDGFDEDLLQKAGENELENYDTFLKEYGTQLSQIEDRLGDAIGDTWDFTVDPVTLNSLPHEHASWFDLLKTDHTVLNKVITVFAALCGEVQELKQKVVLPLAITCMGSAWAVNLPIVSQCKQTIIHASMLGWCYFSSGCSL